MKIWRQLLCGILAVGLLFTGGATVAVSADAVIEDEDTSYDRYIAFGQDLTKKEKKAVLDSFGITEDDLKDYKTIEITNQQEHEYLGEYIDASVIGKRALSSVMIVKTEKDSGIHVTTDNISYCTSGMYCNALITAGLKDAEVKVAGPFSISGTSALVGAMNAYSVMTGQEISEQTMDTATNELVATADLAEAVGDSEKAEQLIAAVKEKVFADGLTNSTDIRDAIDAASNSLGLDISESDRDALVDMLEKVSKEDVDVDAIKEQAGEIYDKLKDAGIDLADVDTKGLVEKIGDFFAGIFDAIVDFFKGLFG
ncbi:MAG: DUF1002 domain-containing protein [Lachnospiraceae bacterium]|nr:DUF1002 domain-containing protein [Lachnospiraceae bacterium]